MDLLLRARPRPGSLRRVLGVAVFLPMFALCACGLEDSPHPPGAENSNTFFTALPESSPKYLDPTSSYSTSETPFTYQVYEPLYRYNYLKRPYTLEGRAAVAVSKPHYLDAQGHELPADAAPEKIDRSVYDIKIKPGILFAPHPAFARDANGQFVYRNLKASDLKDKYQIGDFDKTGTRELTASDYVYAIKRLATPRVKSPAFTVMSQYIIGLKDLSAALRTADAKLRESLSPSARDLPFLDLRQFPLAGAQALDPHTLRVTIKGKYPQFKYWLAMTFFAPIPWEAEAFYAQSGMAEHNFSLNDWPVGTGPYMATEYIENRRHTLVRNPNFRGEPYPCEGSDEDRKDGLLADCGKRMPFIDKIVFTVEKEAIPQENKFLQGFYDEPDLDFTAPWGVVFDVQAHDSAKKAKEFADKGLKFPRSVEPGYFYIGMNWWDPVVGKGKTPEEQERHRKLRQALQIAVDWDEFAQVFEKSAGPPSMGPVPPGVFGYRTGKEGMDPIAYEWKNGRAVRKSIDVAKELMVEAGYPGGRDAKTGQPLVLNYDFFSAPTPDTKPQLDWMVKQFAKLGIQLEIRATDYNRFQDKTDTGAVQIFQWGWNADYPDAENFLFLLYGPNSKAATHGNGENAANYQNDEYDRLFERLRFLDDGPEKQAVMDRMTQIVWNDCPWLWGFNTYSANAAQRWVYNVKPTQLVRDVVEYRRIDPKLRAAELVRWNKPIFWPIGLIALVLFLGLVPAWLGFRKRERASALSSRTGTQSPADFSDRHGPYGTALPVSVPDEGA